MRSFSPARPASGSRRWSGPRSTPCRGSRWLRAVGIESEMAYGYAGLHQLVHPILDAVRELPEPQRAALDAVLRRGPTGAIDPFLVGLAALNLFAVGGTGSAHRGRRRRRGVARPRVAGGTDVRRPPAPRRSCRRAGDHARLDSRTARPAPARASPARPRRAARCRGQRTAGEHRDLARRPLRRQPHRRRVAGQPAGAGRPTRRADRGAARGPGAAS